MEITCSRVSCKGLEEERDRRDKFRGFSSLKGDAGCLVQNASGTSNGDRISWRSKPAAVESGLECWQVYQVQSKVLLLPFTQQSISG